MAEAKSFEINGIDVFVKDEYARNQLDNIANQFTTEQTGNLYKIKYGEKVIAEIPIGGTISPVTYTITNNLTNATNSNEVINIEENTSYSATITPNEGYELSSVIVTMGDTDITSSCYNNGIISIENVTGDIIIIVSCIEITESNFVTDGLVFNLELRNRTSENNTETPPTIVDTIGNKECTVYNVDWDGITSGFVDNGLMLKDPTTIEGINQYNENTYSSVYTPPLVNVDFSKGITLEFTISGHKDGIARIIGIYNGSQGVPIIKTNTTLSRFFENFITTEDKIDNAEYLDYGCFKVTQEQITGEHTYSIRFNLDGKIEVFIDGKVITANGVNYLDLNKNNTFKKFSIAELLNTASMRLGYITSVKSQNIVISEIRFYNKILTDEEITNNYNKTLELQSLINF